MKYLIYAYIFIQLNGIVDKKATTTIKKNTETNIKLNLTRAFAYAWVREKKRELFDESKV